MATQCFICAEFFPSSLELEPLFRTLNPIEVGKKLDQVVSEIIGRPVKRDAITKYVCKTCFKSCEDYNVCQARMASIKTNLQDRHKKGLQKSNTTENVIPIAMFANNSKEIKNEIKTESVNILPKNIKKPIVLSAAKFKTIKPPPYVVLKKSPEKPQNPTMTLTSTVTQLSNESIDTKTSTSLVEAIASLTESKEHHFNSILDFNSLPSNIFDKSDKDILAKSMEVIHNESENENNNMDIDEECGQVLAVKNEIVKSEASNPLPSTSNEDITTNVVETSNNDSDNDNDPIVIGDLEIMQGNDNDDEQHTILMESEDGIGYSIQLASGQKFIYGDKEISLIIPQDDNGDGDASGDDDGDADDPDSNDESQIELQMSGDEETANAIIKASKGEGGAIIAVQSGEFFQVKSVKSKLAEEDDDIISNFVKKQDDTYICALCSNKNQNEHTTFSSNSADKIMEHMKSVHGARIYVCAVCGTVLRKKSEYSKHIAEHGSKPQTSSLKKYECETCHKKFVSRNMLKDHLNTHSGERPHTCSVCNKSFASKYTYQAHQKIHLDRPRPFKCARCPKSFFTQQNLAQHDKTHSGSRDFVCQVCDKAFLTQHNLEVHSLVHSGVKQFVCGLCGKAFARRPEIRDHMRTHTGERPFPCSICGAAFAQRSNLQSHVRATHTDVKRHACDQCGQRFKRRRLLQYHIAARHTGERPFSCETCGASFVYPEHYKKHQRIHNGEKPFDCEVCGRQFNSRDSRNSHRFVHSDKKPYECMVCGAGYMRRPRLYQHMNSAGHLTESIVVNQPKISKDGDKETIELLTESTIKEQVPSTSNILAETEEDDTEFQESEDAMLLPVQLTEELVEITKASNLGDFQLAEGQEEIIANDESGALVRLVQINLPNGGTGWIAVN